MRSFMGTSKDKLNEMIQNLNEVELAEIVDFVEFINNKRQKIFDEAFKNVTEGDESLTEEDLLEVEESKNSGTISYKEMWDGFNEI